MAEDMTETTTNLACPACGKAVELGKSFCSQCGAPLNTGTDKKAQPSLCLACGDEVPADAVFCGSCGTKVQRERTTPASPPPMVAAVERPPLVEAKARIQTREILLGVGASLGVVALIGVGLVLGRFYNKPAPPPPPPLVTEEPPSEPPPLPAPSVAGQVVTAEGLMNIRIFGEGAGDRVRSAAAIQERVEGSLVGIRATYAKELVAHPQLIGMLILEMTIAPDGHVSRVLSHATYIVSEEFQRTVQDLAQDWRFDPTPMGEVSVFYPLLFVPVGIDAKALIGFAQEVLPGRYKIIASEPTPVRQGPGENTEEIGKVSSGLKVEIVSSQGGWLGVLSPKGKIGYVRQEAVSSKVESQ